MVGGHGLSAMVSRTTTATGRLEQCLDSLRQPGGLAESPGRSDTTLSVHSVLTCDGEPRIAELAVLHARKIDLTL